LIDKPKLDNRAWYRILKTLHSLAIIGSITLFLVFEGFFTYEYVKYHSNPVLADYQIARLNSEGFSNYQLRYEAPKFGYSMPATHNEINNFLYPIIIFIPAIIIFKFISETIVYIIVGKEDKD